MRPIVWDWQVIELLSNTPGALPGFFFGLSKSARHKPKKVKKVPVLEEKKCQDYREFMLKERFTI